MPMLELVHDRPDWMNALGVALTRPPGVAERRGGDDPWAAGERERPRRISDDLAWLRQAVDEPEVNGLHAVEGTAAVGVWRPDPQQDTMSRLVRLRERGVLDAAGFLLHEETAELEG